MSLKINATADRIATTLRKAPKFDANALGWEAVRDLCDIATGGEVDGKPLDLLTDAVWTRLGGVAR